MTSSRASYLPHKVPEKASFITFKAGQALFALAVDRIQYITSANSITVHEAPNQQNQMQNVFDFAGKPTLLYSFSKIIGGQSQSEIVADLNALLAQREQDHIGWINALEHSILTGEPFTKATDPHKCAFGLWYDNYKPDDDELASIMARFDAPHKRIHSLAEKLLALAKNETGVKEAIALLQQERISTLKELMHIFNLARSRLDDILKPVVIIIDCGNESFAIKLDNIGDIKEFDSSHWLPQDSQYEQALSCHEGFYQTQNNELYLKLCPKKMKEEIKQKKLNG